WWNIWFYDHPLDVERLKLIHIEFDASPFIPGPGLLEVAVNWSTDLWDTPGEPPLPGVDEELYIGRETIVLVEDMTELEHFSLDVILPNFNPEWVSIDVRGSNFIIESGSISHTCIAPESMDLAFVITGEAPPIPTLSEWGLIIFTLLMLGLITWTIIRRRKVATASV
ncbi:MAG: IPTL-CTERM sorting domain-containing protein, partial [candidate division Zixibacteria bacterium]|nr:IPTL-CTERM sorting domain-containing protein [candidate division Zixibacteria bacterium]